MIPSRQQLLLPVLETIHELGGRAKPSDVIAAVSDRFQVPKEVVDAKVEYHWAKWGSRVRSPWKQGIHWVRQEAVLRGLIGKNERGYWTITEKGTEALVTCRPGMIFVVWETPNGEAVWSDAITAAGSLKDGSIDLLFTSPPYPIINGRNYGSFSESDIIELVMKCAPDWRRSLSDTGSLVLNFKDCWLPSSVTGGAPVRSIYIDKLVCALTEHAKLHLADRHIFRNPACAPTTPWVTVQKIRAGCDWEHMLWFSRSGRPFADATAVMEPAKESSVKTYLAKARRNQKNKTCESGQNNIFEEQVAKAAAGQQIMVLPRTIQTFANSDPQTKLKAALAAAGLPKHPAKMPLGLAEWWIKFLTKRGQMVHDPFAGSFTTALAAEKLGRRWSASERFLPYIMGGALRFEEVSFGPDMPLATGTEG